MFSHLRTDTDWARLCEPPAGLRFAADSALDADLQTLYRLIAEYRLWQQVRFEYIETGKIRVSMADVIDKQLPISIGMIHDCLWGLLQFSRRWPAATINLAYFHEFWVGLWPSPPE